MCFAQPLQVYIPCTMRLATKANGRASLDKEERHPPGRWGGTSLTCSALVVSTRCAGASSTVGPSQLFSISMCKASIPPQLKPTITSGCWPGRDPVNHNGTSKSDPIETLSRAMAMEKQLQRRRRRRRQRQQQQQQEAAGSSRKQQETAASSSKQQQEGKE